MMYEMTIPLFKKGLRNLSKVLDKGAAAADAKKYEVGVLLNARLAPDQFNLIRQIQIACDTAKLAAHRLTGRPVPVNDDSEKSLAELKSRIDSTLSYLDGFAPDDFKGSEEKHITTPRWEGKWLTGVELVHHHVLPNFYFHITTAYAILRHNGVDVGKKDYLGEMPYKQ